MKRSHPSDPASIRERLFSLKDESYKAFQIKLIPTVDPSRVIGVRTPLLRSVAKDMAKEGSHSAFLRELPHKTFDENQLHAFLLSGEKNFTRCAEGVEAFLPYVDNWATCDQLSPKAFRKNKKDLLPLVLRWIESTHTYTTRFGIKQLMDLFLDDSFRMEYAERVSKIQSEEYYVKMMIAWYFATALAKHFNEVFPFFAEKRLPKWTHNKAIQKALESFRVTNEHKEILKKMKY